MAELPESVRPGICTVSQSNLVNPQRWPSQARRSHVRIRIQEDAPAIPRRVQEAAQTVGTRGGALVPHVVVPVAPQAHACAVHQAPGAEAHPVCERVLRRPLDEPLVVLRHVFDRGSPARNQAPPNAGRDRDDHVPARHQAPSPRCPAPQKNRVVDRQAVPPRGRSTVAWVLPRTMNAPQATPMGGQAGNQCKINNKSDWQPA